MWTDTLTSNFEHKLNKGQIILKNCPFCQDDNFNLEFSIDKAIFHCWRCDVSGRVNKFLKFVGKEPDNDNWQVSLTRQESDKEDFDEVDSFIPMKFMDCPKLLVAKGLDAIDLKTYGIMLGTTGKYKDKIIIPLYEDERLTYTVVRDVHIAGHYYNPSNVSKTNVLPYFIGAINKYTWYLCEGVFDAISIHKLGFSVAVLLGSNISKGQIQKLKDFGCKKVIVALDGDATAKAVKIYDILEQNSIDSGVVFFDQDEEPNSLYVKDSDALLKKLLGYSEITLETRIKQKLGRL